MTGSVTVAVSSMTGGHGAWNFIVMVCVKIGQSWVKIARLQDSFFLPCNSHVSSLISLFPQQICLVLFYETSKAVKIQPPSFLCLASSGKLL